MYYGFAWANDSRHFFYTRVDEAKRPWQLWRHELGTSSDDDVLVYQEDDAQYTRVGRPQSRRPDDRRHRLSSSMTTEVRYVSADDPTGELRGPRGAATRHRIRRRALRGRGGVAWWLKITNEDATDFRLLARPVGGDEWREIIPERPGCRLDGVDAFDSFLALSERENGCAALRLVPLLAGEDPFGDNLLERSALVEGGAFPNTVALSANPNFDTSQLRVLITSLTTPRLVADVVVDTGEVIVRKQQIVVGGYDESHYVTGRLWVRASDGVQIAGLGRRSSRPRRRARRRRPSHRRQPSPVPALRIRQLRDLRSIRRSPRFVSRCSNAASIFAIAHIRGGGEMGRSWYEMGRLAQKPTTFSDFLSVAQVVRRNGLDHASAARRPGRFGRRAPDGRGA